MSQIKNAEIKILYIKTNEISLLDIPRVLDELGYEVYQINFEIKAQTYEQDSCEKIISAIDEMQIHYVISYDFILTISQACMETGTPYVAWVYDAPQWELYTPYAFYPCNYIFAFDKMQVHRLKSIGIKHVVHMPLAVHVNKINMVANVGDKIKTGYQHDIVFIGQLYKMENDDTVLEQMDENLRHQICQNIDACFMKWDKDIHIHGMMSEECVAYLGAADGHEKKVSYPYMSEQFCYEAAFLSKIIANRERVHILNKLADKYNVTFYTNDKNTKQLSEKVKIKPGMSYDVLSHVYHRSKINLNLTLHCIETGVPQRVLDVMAAGGFMLTNYQEELEEMFVPGEEIAIYHNEQELEELVDYYLTHEEERECIARKGQEKVLREYDFRKALVKVMQYVSEEERDREEKYISIQCKELRKRADFLLSQKVESAYQQLYELFTNKVYETTIRKYTDLSTLQVMVEFWQNEMLSGKPCIFDDVDNIQQAEQKYLKLKHALWRIEQNLSYEKCIEAIEYLRQKSISKFLIAWMICTNLREREDTFVKLGKMMAEFSLVEAVEVLTYGLLFLKNSQKLLVQKADFLMELNLWEEALKTLKTIETPTEEINEIIRELSDVLYGTKE